MAAWRAHWSRGGGAGLLAMLCLLAAPAAAEAALALEATAQTTGYVSLRIGAPPGTAVTINEVAGPAAEPVAAFTAAGDTTVLARAAPWRCDRRVRTFVALAGTESAGATVRTPSCARRLGLTLARRITLGRPAGVVVRDRWRLGGVLLALCAVPPGGAAGCRPEQLGASALRTRLDLGRPGTWRVRAVAPWGGVERSVRVVRRGGLRLLVTGDSMIQPLDDFLRTRLRPRGVRSTSDPRIATGISKPAGLDWPAHARSQVAALHPDVTVVLLGANDAFAIGAAQCCDAAWIQAYAARAQGMMETYARAGRGRVYWLALPAPRGGFFRVSFRAVNAALRQAARAAGTDVRLIRTDRYFTPGGRYRSAMRIGGHRVRVRQADGVHLSAAGASAAADLVIGTLRRERIVR